MSTIFVSNGGFDMPTTIKPVCSHTYGVGPGYEGDLYWYYNQDDIGMNDTGFYYCPDCGQKLVKEQSDA